VEYEEPTWGRVTAEEMRSIVVLSPHFDDAVMGAGQMLLHHAGQSATTVITVLGGRPPAYPDPPSPWDALGGFQSGDDVVAIRREEDRAAMAVMGATPVWLEFPDHQYLAPEDRPTPEQVAPVLEQAILAAEPTAVFAPMGIANPDHVMTHEAARIVLGRHPELSWFCYEDQGYKHLPGMLAWRVSKLFRSGLWPTPEPVPVTLDVETKHKALWCYTSQIPPLEQDHGLTRRLEAHVPEQFWRLAPPPRGWERMVDH
jgi:LmbE family N-acetylglucosaminyl deacetylase